MPLTTPARYPLYAAVTDAWSEAEIPDINANAPVSEFAVIALWSEAEFESSVVNLAIVYPGVAAIYEATPCKLDK